MPVRLIGPMNMTAKDDGLVWALSDQFGECRRTSGCCDLVEGPVSDREGWMVHDDDDVACTGSGEFPFHTCERLFG